MLFLGHKWLKNGNWHLIQKQKHSFKQNREYQVNFSKLEIVGQSFVQETYGWLILEHFHPNEVALKWLDTVPFSMIKYGDIFLLQPMFIISN